ncbi:hypothetical protein GW17_00019938 [Ensete ventricosum]|nr:hypothetical protein GW17_00019938 [Ensete ventricosum]
MRASARDLLLQQGYSSPNQGPSIDAFEASLRMGGTSSYIAAQRRRREWSIGMDLAMGEAYGAWNGGRALSASNPLNYWKINDGVASMIDIECKEPTIECVLCFSSRLVDDARTQTTTTEPPNLTRHRRLSRVVPDVEPTRKDSSAAVGGSVAHFVGGRTLGGEEALTCPTECRRKRVGQAVPLR